MTSDLMQEQGKPDELGQYLQQIRQYPRLTAEEERQLAMACAAGDEDAIRQMVNSNLRLVVSVAREYAGRGVPLMDLIQEGSIGLLSAARKFDYTREYRFSTYATEWIRQGITRCLLSHGLIRVPAYTAERIRKVNAAKNALLQRDGVEPTVQQIALECAMPCDKVEKLLNLEPEVCSLDVPVGDGDENLGALLQNTQAAEPFEQLVRQQLEQTMKNLLGALDERQQLTLKLHFGIEDGQCRSLEQISRELGVSKERVRQIQRQAMDKLQKLGSSMGLEDFLK